MQPLSGRSAIRARSRLGKYRIVKRLAEGGFARVFEAIDSIEGVRVALKIPHEHLVNKETLDAFRQEARVHAALDHPNILPVKNAEVIDGHFVIAYPLGKRSLDARLRNRVSTTRLMEFAEQMLEGVAFAHGKGVVHCDLKPENFILFEGDRLRLADFGVARLARRTVRGSGSGTIGFSAPEHAMGQTSFRSDVFSLGLIFWLMLTGELPEWPFDWPPAGHSRIKGKLPDEFLAWLERSMQLDPKRRFADAGQMLAAFRKLKPRVRRHLSGERKRRAQRGRGSNQGGRSAAMAVTTSTTRDWRQLRFRMFERMHRHDLHLDRLCGHCEGPVGEAMSFCPWCRESLAFDPDDTSFPDACGRCCRGRKLDWNYCAWCYGKSFDEVSSRSYEDKRYIDEACRHCDHPLMSFMRYCPGCRRKTSNKWTLDGVRDRCGRCGWGVSREYWEGCAWCGAHLGKK